MHVMTAADLYYDLHVLLYVRPVLCVCVCRMGATPHALVAVQTRIVACGHVQ